MFEVSADVALVKLLNRSLLAVNFAKREVKDLGWNEDPKLFAAGARSGLIAIAASDRVRFFPDAGAGTAFNLPIPRATSLLVLGESGLVAVGDATGEIRLIDVSDVSGSFK